MVRKCPKCGSTHTEMEGEDIHFLVCLDCGYDEGDEYAIAEERAGKGGKGSPYKRGGSLRTQK